MEQQVLTSCLRGGHDGFRNNNNASREEEEMRVYLPPSDVLLAATSPPSLLARGHLDNTTAASSSSVPLGRTAVVSVEMDNHPSEGGSYELSELPIAAADTLGRSLLDLMQELVAMAPPPPHFSLTGRSLLGGRGRNGGGGGSSFPPALIEFLIRHWRHDYDLEAQRRLERFWSDSYLEAGRQGHRVAHLLPVVTATTTADSAQRTTGGAAVTPVHEPSEVTKILKGVMVQAFASFLSACVTAYPQVKDAPDYVKLTIFGGLAFTTVGLFAGILSTTVARRRLAMRLVSFSAIAVLTFSVASQLSSRICIVLTALVGVAVNLLIMRLRF